MLSSLTCKGTLRQVFICLRPRTRRLEGNSHKAGSKIPTIWLIYLQSINSYKHLPLCSFTIDLDDDILVCFLFSYLVHAEKQYIY